MDAKTRKVRDFFNRVAPNRSYWYRTNRYYHEAIRQFLSFLIPPGKRVLEVGCGTGDLLASLVPWEGFGVDIAPKMVAIAKKYHPKLRFRVADAQTLNIRKTFDFIVLSDVIGNFSDIQATFTRLHAACAEHTRIVVTYYNFLWEPFIWLAEHLGFKMPQPPQNWLSSRDIDNLLYLSDFEVVQKSTFLLLPIYIPIISVIFNRYLARLPLFKHLCLCLYAVVREHKQPTTKQNYAVSVIVPARNEAGTIEELVRRVPTFGKQTEIIFVEGGSHDNTRQAIHRVMRKYSKIPIILVPQGRGTGKADAVRKGFAKATGDILMILDADLSVAPEDLTKFYHALVSGKGELVIGSRLVYPLESQAMRFLNILGNKFFSIAFSWILNQPVKDTLCGTKALWRRDYQAIAKNRRYFGNFDPFGDFDLLFGAAKLNLKITEIQVVYHARRYGQTNISRFRHGWLLAKMTLVGMFKLKFI